MGILNVTPDSFSDGGRHFSLAAAVAHGERLAAAGADLIDVGGESTRPGSAPVTPEEELRRVLPVVEELRRRLADVTISIDTVKPEVAEAACRAGARFVNDVSMLRAGSDLARVARDFDASLVLMHSRGTPADMQRGPRYDDVLAEVKSELLAAVERALAAGLPRERIWLDPGIGFAKRLEDNLALLARLDELVALGLPVLVGPSRKSFIAAIDESPVDQRLGGTLAAVTLSIWHGAAGVRVHDLAESRQAALIATAIRLGRAA